MVRITNRMETAQYQYEGEFQISGSTRVQGGHIYTLDGSIQKEGAYVGNVNVNQNGDNPQISVNVPRKDLALATADVLTMCDEIEAEFNLK